MLTTFEKIVLSASAIAIILGTVFANIAAEQGDRNDPTESSASRGRSIIIEEVE